MKNMKKKILAIGTLSLMFAMVAYAGVIISQQDMPTPPSHKIPFDQLSKQQLTKIIEPMSTIPQLVIAKKFGITTIHGKKINFSNSKNVAGPTKTFMDTGVATDPIVTDNEPTVAYKPNNTNILIAATNDAPAPFSYGACAVYMSLNKGLSWTKSFLPLFLPTDVCADPVVRWAPNGGRVYATYISFDPSFISSNIVVSTSTDNGVTWSSPVVAIPGSSATFTDKPWGDVHTYAPNVNTNNRLYVTSTLFNSDGSINIAFTSSTNGGLTFSPVTILATNPGFPLAIQGSRPIGGLSTSSTAGDVLVCWYNSDLDGWLVGGFSTRCDHSPDYGTTWDPEVVAFESSTYGLFEVPFSLGPNGIFERWWGSMEPSLMITGDGQAHMVLTADITDANTFPFTSDDGEIFYFNSVPPYNLWTPPKRIDDDFFSGEAHGYPTITAKRLTNGYALVASWVDYRNSPFFVPLGYDCGTNGDALNCFYDIYTAQTNPGWSSQPNVKLNDVPSLSDDLFDGDYIDSSANRITSNNLVQVAWTDRRFSTSISADIDHTNVYTGKVTVTG